MRVLFITLTNIGDVVLSTTLLNRILAQYPEAVVDVACGHRAASLFEGMPNLGKLHPIEKKKHHMHYVGVWQAFRNQKYDVIIDLRTPFLSLFLSGRKKIVFNKKTATGHRGVQFANLWPMENGPIKQVVWAPDDIHKQVDDFIKDDAPLVALAPTANWLGKQWPQFRFAQTVKALDQIADLNGAKFVVLGAQHERPGVDDLLNKIKPERLYDLVGKTDLPQAYAWLKRCKVFIGNDSGLAHLAAAADIPTVTLFGPTPEHLYAPLTGENGRLVMPAKREEDNINLEPEAMPRIITDIKPEQVLDAVYDLLGKHGKVTG